MQAKFLGGVLVTASLLLAGCGDEAEERLSGPRLDLVIGSSEPVSGELESFGPSARKAAELAEGVIDDAIVATGAPHSVEIAHADNGGGDDPKLAVASARKLIDDEGASCIVGPWASTDTVQVAEEVAIPEGVMLITPSAPAEEISDLDDEGLVVRTTPPDTAQASSLAGAIAEDLGDAEGAVVGIGARDDAYGQALSASFVEAWRQRGGEVANEVLYPPTGVGLERFAPRILAGDPDATVIFDFPESFSALLPELQSTGEYRPAATWSADGLAAGELPDELDRDLVEGLRLTVPGVPEEDEATRQYRARYDDADPRGVAPSTFDAQTFDAVVLCYLSAVAAGSTDGEALAEEARALTAPPGAVHSWQALGDAIRALADGAQIDYQGASGPLNLDRAGDPTTGVHDLYEFQNGELKEIGEAPYTLK